MRNLGLGRYLLGWGGLVIGLLLVGEAMAGLLPSVGGSGRAPVVAGILVAAVVDVPVYLLVAHGLLVRPARFMRWWGISVLGKFACFGLVAVVVLSWDLVPREPFLLAMVIAFLGLTFHQVLRLVSLVDARESAGRCR